jgi:hypothetical protein
VAVHSRWQRAFENALDRTAACQPPNWFYLSLIAGVTPRYCRVQQQQEHREADGLQDSTHPPPVQTHLACVHAVKHVPLAALHPATRVDVGQLTTRTCSSNSSD